MNRSTFTAFFVAILLFLLFADRGRTDEIDPKYRNVISKGLEYLARVQHRDGHWDANGGTYPTTMTALAGMALLMEGSTMRDGKYAEHIRKAVDWLMDRCQRNGLIGNPNNPSESARYMYGHGYSLLFLAQIYGEEEDNDRRKKLEGILTRAVEFTGKAQTSRGGWGYVSSADGGGFDEGSVTITQVQALRAARNAGIAVPKGIIDKAQDYLRKCTTARGGIIYSLAHGAAFNGAERPPLTAAAIACAFSSGEYNSKEAKQWIKYCQTAIPIDKSGRDSFGHWEYTHYYYAQAIYMLGEEGYAKLFPASAPSEQLTWNKYRDVIFDYLASRQSADGSWNLGHIGPVFTTACHLTILQLDNGTLPIYQR
jgi:Prenyltransferase and squalene oxidase repeat